MCMLNDCIPMWIVQSFLHMSWKSWSMNLLPWSRVTKEGRRYHTNHSCLTIIATVIDFLSLYYLILNQPVVGSIIVTHFKGGILTPFTLFLILYGPMRSMHNHSHGFTCSASFSGKSPYFLLCFFWVWQMSHIETSFVIWSLIFGQ